MAPAGNRRSSYSRRAQYGIFTGYVVAVIGAVAGAVLLGISLFSPQAFSGLRSTAFDLSEPAAQAAASGRTARNGLFGTITAYVDAGRKNADLKRELEVARVRLAEAEAVKAENLRLKALLRISASEPKPVATARLIGSTASSTRRFAYISVGRDRGVLPGMPVRSAKGLVGRVLEAGGGSARILLLTDSESMVPVRRAKDDVVAFAEGQADGTLRLRLINLGINPLRKGDVFVTSGAGGMFRPGIAVAVAQTITRDGAIAHVLSDPTATDFVLIDPIWQPAARAMIAAPRWNGGERDATPQGEAGPQGDVGSPRPSSQGRPVE